MSYGTYFKIDYIHSFTRSFVRSFISDSKVHSKNRNRQTEQTDKPETNLRPTTVNTLNYLPSNRNLLTNV